MKKVIAIIALTLTSFITLAQVTVNGGNIINATSTTPDNIFINTRAITNSGELNIRATTTDNAVDAFELRNAGGGPSDGTYTPMLVGTRGRLLPSGIGLGASLVLMANIDNANMDVATASSMMTFNTRRGYVPNTANGVAISNRSLFQWVNGVNPQMTMASNGSLGIGIVNPSARVHIRTDKATLANEKISTEDMTLELAVAANNGEYGVQKGDAFIWTNQTSTTKNLRGNLYLNTGSQSNVNTPNSRNIILGSLNRNTLVVSDAGRVGIGLDNLGSPIANITRPDRLLHVNSRNVADIRFQNLPTRNCGFLLMVDANGDVFRTPMQGDPCMEACQTTTPRPAFGERYEELIKQVDNLKKEIEILKSKVK